MNRTCFALSLLLAASVAAMPAVARPVKGAWTAVADDDRPDRLQFSMHTARHDQNGSTFAIGDFTGLTAAQVGATTSSDVTFELRREAGTIAFDGTFRNGDGAGQFAFTPDPGYATALKKLGVAFDADGDADRTQFQITLFDVSTAFIRSMQELGYHESLDTYQQFRIFGVDPAYVHDMAAVGFDHLGAEKLVETRIHGATPDYIRSMRKSGRDLSLDDYIRARIFAITPEFEAEMAKAGYANLEHDRLVEFKIHGVTPAFVAELRSLGYTHVSAQHLVDMRIHGVTPDFIRRVEKAGYHHVPVDKLVEMRIFDIEPEMVKALDDADKK